MSQQVFSREEIRQAVREALHEALPPTDRRQVSATKVTNCRLMKKILESAQGNFKTPVPVEIDSDRAINDFAIDLTKCLQDENVAALIRSGRVKFHSAVDSHSTQAAPPTKTLAAEHRHGSSERAVIDGRITSGVLTESKILTLAKNHSRIEVSKDVILTPLAKDRARRLNIKIVRQ